MAYGNFTTERSFLEPQYAEIIDKRSSELPIASTNTSEDIMGSKTTKGSTLMSSSNPTLGSSMGGTLIQNKSSLGSGASSPSKQLMTKGGGNLGVIEEELMVEEDCDNELEKSRITIQNIRQKTTKFGGNIDHASLT